MKRTKLKDRLLPDYTKGEEIFNSVSHGVGALLGIAALVLCVVIAALRGNARAVVSASIYGSTIIILYTVSTLYHGITHTLTKKVFQVIDHCSIFFLIAGSYTPITLVTLHDVKPAYGWSLFGIVWGITIIGCVFTAIDWKKYNVLSMICYLGMGWCIILFIVDVAKSLGVGGTVFLATGGVLYTIGAVLYMIGHKHRYFHSVFHLFVLAGSIMHFFTILLYILPCERPFF